jgi:uncharacterized membrane protein YbhN (UPF0104 family)
MNEPDHRSQPLEYFNPEPPKWNDALAVAAAGAVLGIVIVIFGGFGVMNVVGYPLIAGGTLPPPAVQWWAPMLFFAVVIGSATGAVLLYRAKRPWFLIGLLIGIGLMSLVEGLCFANP